MATKEMSVTANNDAQLVGESLSGDREAFGQIVARYQSLICSLAYCATGSLTQSEDLAQETFVTAWRQLRNLTDPEKFRSWLCGIARNLINNFLRREGREPAYRAEPLDDSATQWPSHDPTPVEQTISREEEALLWRALERIPLTYREPLALYYRERHSIARVAEALDLNEEAVKQRLSRGRKLLQEQVLSFVEGALERTSPGRTFTASVLQALPAMAMSTKTTAAGAGATAKAFSAASLIGVFLTFPLAFLGNYFGYKMSMESAQSDGERNYIKKAYQRLLFLVLGFGAAYALLIFWGVASGQRHPAVLTTLILAVSAAYLLLTIGLGVSAYRRRKEINVHRQLEGGRRRPGLPAWEYRTRAQFLGIPLIHIRVGEDSTTRLKPVKAWIAAGNKAIGGFFAFGGVAIAPLSIGAIAIGIVPFGGCALGVLALGGFSIGLWSFGGLAIGWLAYGGCAIAWDAAWGGMAVARHCALGGIAEAAQANNDIAAHHVQTISFFRQSNVLIRYMGWMNLVWVVPMFFWWRRRAGRQKFPPVILE